MYRRVAFTKPASAARGLGVWPKVCGHSHSLFSMLYATSWLFQPLPPYHWWLVSETYSYCVWRRSSQVGGVPNPPKKKTLNSCIAIAVMLLVHGWISGTCYYMTTRSVCPCGAVFSHPVRVWSRSTNEGRAGRYCYYYLPGLGLQSSLRATVC